jgi:MFS family permease
VLFDGHIRNIENLEHSIYWTFTLSSFLELPSDLLSIIGLEVVGRRWSAVLSLVGSGIAMMMCAVFHSQVMLVTIMAMVGRFFITYSMNTAAQISLETVPTELRGQGTALANVCAQVATLFAPQIVYSVSSFAQKIES